MRNADETALRIAHARQGSALGAKFDFPDLLDPRYLLTEVALRSGEVIGAVTFHATLEAMFIGGDAAMVRDAVRRCSEFERHLEALGADEVHAFVPRRAQRRMQPILRRLGFRRSNQEYVPYYREI